MYVFDTYTDKRIRLFTNTGYCMSLCIEDIPESKPNSRPVSLASLIPTENGEGLYQHLLGTLIAFYSFILKMEWQRPRKLPSLKQNNSAL